MQMVMPHILISRRFVMLAGRYAGATIDLLHDNRKATSDIVNGGRHIQRQVENILEVSIGNDKDVPPIVGPLMRTYKSCYNGIAVNFVALNRKDVFVFNAARKQAEGADVTVWSMVEHKPIIAWREARPCSRRTFESTRNRLQRDAELRVVKLCVRPAAI